MAVQKPPTTRVGKEIVRLMDKRGIVPSTMTYRGKTQAGDGLEHSVLSRVIHGKHTLTVQLAVRIATALYASPRVLLHLWVDDIMDKMGVPPDGK